MKPFFMGKNMNSEELMAEFEHRIREQIVIDEASPSGLRWNHLANQGVRNKPAGTLIQGYWRVRVGIYEKVRTFAAHRVVWFLSNGRWPKDQIDHVNGKKSDNRIANLREASNKENQRNAGKRMDSSSGVKGVHFNKKRNRWCARLAGEHGRIQIGYFVDLEDAEEAIRAAREKLHGEFTNHGTHRETSQ